MSNLKGFDRTLTIILTIILIAAIVATIYIIVFPQPSEKFTEFYILGPDGKAGNYPDNLTAGQNGNLIIGIVNHESADVTYMLIVRFNQATIRNDTISLKNKEKKEKESKEKRKFHSLLWHQTPVKTSEWNFYCINCPIVQMYTVRFICR